MVIYILFIILGIITYFIYILKRYNNHCESFATSSSASESSSQEPCSTNLTDLQYLEHMIPHHQVAVDMSKVLLKNTKKN